jgi:hypothetical protein
VLRGSAGGCVEVPQDKTGAPLLAVFEKWD